MEDSLMLFSYEDYRDFLKDYFEKKKRIKKTFSFRYFAQIAGFKDHSQLTHLVSGRRNVTNKTLAKLIKGIGLTGNSKDYFVSLVNFTQSKDKEEKCTWFNKLQTIREQRERDILEQERYTQFDKWYYYTIRDLATTDLWEGDYKKLGALLKPHILEEKAKEAVELLVDIGLLEEKDGSFYKPDEVIMPSIISKEMVNSARRDILGIGALASETCSPSERYFLNYGVMVTDNNLDKYYKLVDEFEKEIKELALEETEDVDRMYQINLQFFPTSKDLTIKGDSK